MRDQQQQQQLQSSELERLARARWPRVDEWPAAIQQAAPAQEKDKDKEKELPAEEERLEVGLTEVRKWRLQVLLASHRYGVPSLALADTYRRMFNQELRFEQWGFDGLSDLVARLDQLISVQEPDSQTALLFPHYKHDRILHDARYQHSFAAAAAAASDSPQPLAADSNAGASHTPAADGGSTVEGASPTAFADSELLISRAWLNRDEELPDDVVLAGEQYPELVLPMSEAKLAAEEAGHSASLYRAMIVSAADPHHLYVHVKNGALDTLDSLSARAHHFFKHQSRFPVEMYSIPQEFLYPGFPCLAFNRNLGTFERAAIKRRPSNAADRPAAASNRRRQVLVELVDFGGQLLVPALDLFLMPRQFLQFPRQALRVALAGLQPPAGSDKWTVSAGRRLRCFSNRHYWLECLLLPPPPPQAASPTNPSGTTDAPSAAAGATSSSNSSADSSSDSSSPEASSNSSPVAVRRRAEAHRRSRQPQPVQFEVILCDRNDDQLDLFLDEVLVMETYAARDPARADHLARLKEQLAEAMGPLARPRNPFLD